MWSRHSPWARRRLARAAYLWGLGAFGQGVERVLDLRPNAGGHAAMWRPLGELNQLCAACDVINAYARQHLAGAVTVSLWVMSGHFKTSDVSVFAGGPSL
jgi:hypothetical protein